MSRWPLISMPPSRLRRRAGSLSLRTLRVALSAPKRWILPVAMRLAGTRPPANAIQCLRRECQGSTSRITFEIEEAGVQISRHEKGLHPFYTSRSMASPGPPRPRCSPMSEQSPTSQFIDAHKRGSLSMASRQSNKAFPTVDPTTELAHSAM